MDLYAFLFHICFFKYITIATIYWYELFMDRIFKKITQSMIIKFKLFEQTQVQDKETLYDFVKRIVSGEFDDIDIEKKLGIDENKYEISDSTDTESVEIKGSLKKNGKPRKVRYIKMKVIEDLKSETITAAVKENISPCAKLDTDDSTSYVELKNIVKEHNPKVLTKDKVGTALPWVHLAISNSKRVLLDMYHGIKPEYLQNYLDEFCYNFNRRYFGEALFERLLTVAVSDKNSFRYNIG